jgi:hypothetical protein
VLVLADHVPVRIAELGAQISQGVLIELELPLEQAIRDAPTPLQYGKSLVEELLKGHHRPLIYP